MFQKSEQLNLTLAWCDEKGSLEPLNLNHLQLRWPSVKIKSHCKELIYQPWEWGERQLSCTNQQNENIFKSFIQIQINIPQSSLHMLNPLPVGIPHTTLQLMRNILFIYFFKENEPTKLSSTRLYKRTGMCQLSYMPKRLYTIYCVDRSCVGEITRQLHNIIIAYTFGIDSDLTLLCRQCCLTQA